MKKLLSRNLFELVAALMLGAMLVLGGMPSAALADTQNYASSVNVTPVPILISGQRTASITAVARFKVPTKIKLIGVSATARASGGTTPTLAVDVLAGGVTVLAAPISVTAGTVTEGVIATSAIADETVVTVNLTITGTSPTWDDINVLLTFIPL